MKEYDIYLFDADGTLTDTCELIYQNYRKTCLYFSKEEPTREAVVSTIGIPLRAQLSLFLGELSDVQYQEAQRVHMEYQTAMYKEYLTIFAGTKEILQRLKDAEKRLAVVTSRRRESLVRYLKHTEILDFFEELITPEDTAKHKPDAAPVIEALSRFPEGTSIFIGDSRFDIESGVAAGVDTCFVNWSISGLGDSKAVPSYRIDSWDELF